MAAKFKPSDFSHIIWIGNPQSHTTGAGINVTSFHLNYFLHCKQQKRTLTQQYSLIGTRLDNSITMITRHDARNIVYKQAQLDTDRTVYNIVDVSTDDSNDYIRYDYLTLVKITKGA